MTPTTPLSPAAQAVLDALKEEWVAEPDEMEFNAILAGLGAAALRAATDQVVPDDYHPQRTASYPEAQAFVDGKECRNESVRYQLLAIAAELEARP